MRYQVLCTLVSLGFLGASCVSAPPTRTPEIDVELPDEWVARDGLGEFEGDGWWRQFDDPTLMELVSQAITGNFDLQVATARVEAAAAEARIAGADLYPRVNAGFDVARQKQNFIGLPIPGGSGDVLSTRSTRLNLGVNATWEIDLWGRIRHGQSAAFADLQATEAALDATRQSVAALVCRTWFQAVEALAQISLTESTVGSFRQSVDWIDGRYRLGLRSPLDLRLARTNLATAMALLEQQRQQYSEIIRQLEILLGQYPSGELIVAEQLPAMPESVPAGLPADTVARRFDLIEAERVLAASDARVRQARAALYPRLSLTASGGFASEEIKDLLSGDFSVWSLAGNLLQPVFEGWRLRAGVDLASAGAKASYANYAAAVLNAFAEVESALAAERRLEAQERELAIAVEEAQAANALARDQYGTGLVDILTYLEAERREFNSRSQLLVVQRARLEARVQLHLALGGDFVPLEARLTVSADAAEPSKDTLDAMP